MSYAVADAGDFEGRRKPIRRALGVSAFGLNQFDSQPGQAGFAHDEAETGQEEVYVVLAGTGAIVVDGDEVALGPGRYVFVAPEATRQVVAGPDGLSYAVVGVRPGCYPQEG